MEKEGVAEERIDLLPLTPGNREHLEMYSQMDISLDPWPYAGTTTTCESLFMGVPVISLAGTDLGFCFHLFRANMDPVFAQNALTVSGQPWLLLCYSEQLFAVY